MTFFELFRRSKAAAPTPAPASGTDAILESAPDPDEELLRYPPFMKGLPASDVDALLAKQTELIRRLQDGVGMTDTGYRQLVLPVVRRRDPWARDPSRRRAHRRLRGEQADLQRMAQQAARAAVLRWASEAGGRFTKAATH